MSNTISNIQRSNMAIKVEIQKKQTTENAEETKQGQIQKQDAVIIGKGFEKPVIYSKAGYKLSAEEVREIKGQEQQNLMHLRNLVRQLILKQNKENGEVDAMNDLSDILAEGDADIASAGTEAVTGVGRTGSVMDLEGEYGVEAVSDRIVNFAISVSGGDKSKLDQLIAAIDEGFGQAVKVFGGTLPEICGRTHDAIMEKLEAWKNEE